MICHNIKIMEIFVFSLDTNASESYNIYFVSGKFLQKNNTRQNIQKGMAVCESNS